MKFWDSLIGRFVTINLWDLVRQIWKSTIYDTDKDDGADTDKDDGSNRGQSLVSKLDDIKGILLRFFPVRRRRAISNRETLMSFCDVEMKKSEDELGSVIFLSKQHGVLSRNIYSILAPWAPIQD